ncbi:MAG: rRNA maturation RNase YbeY [Spirochaetales bacterium]|nr:rRNA maturation RNase YbeY [Leptospiraceae bacterium]MCP5481911.1 rRNA maturation RNase YbeY [Spirochaetales bacterium]MCP5486283.1 rRNA maturation RNase YbeY [Spirochaetales bacterium]
MITVSVERDDGIPDRVPSAKALSTFAEFVVEALSSKLKLASDWQMSVIVLDDEAMRAVNREHRGKDRPTDVLSFPLCEFDAGDDSEVQFPGQPRLLGDLLISYEAAVRQAEAIGHDLEAEFERLMVHGILHLFGYDHETSEQDRLQMEALEDELLVLWDNRLSHR